MRRLLARMANFLSPGRAEKEMSREIRSHLALLEEQYLNDGMSPADARLAAERAYGGVEQVKELHREERSLVWLEQTVQDVRYALRSLGKSPGFLAVTVLTLALGIGANTAIFSIIHTVLLRPLPYPNASELVAISSRSKLAGVPIVSWSKFSLMQQQTRTLEMSGAFFLYGLNILVDKTPEQIAGARVNKDLFPMFGVTPAMGRGFLPAEDAEGGAQVAMIGDAFWRNRMGSDPNAVGRTISCDGKPTLIVGVLPAGFHFPFIQPEPEIWFPRTFDNPGYTPDRIRTGASYLLLYGRRRAGVSVAEVQAEMDAINAHYKESTPGAADAEWTLGVTSLQDSLVKDLRLSLLALLGAVGFVLLIACVNVANLLMARATTREREMALRAALGATRGRLARQLLAESMLLALIGGALGILLAWVALPVAMHALTPGTIPLAEEIRVDRVVMLFSVLICAFTGIAFGLVPALQTPSQHLQDTLKEGSRGSGGARGNRVRRMMVVSEVALAVVLASGAGLLIKSMLNLMHASPGFVASNVTSFPFSMPPGRYPNPAARTDFYRRLLERAHTIPGAETVAMTSHLPLNGGARFVFFCPQGTPCLGVGKDPVAAWRQISPDFLTAMRIPLLQGRAFTEHDLANSSPVVIINQTMARRFFSTSNPLGQHIANSRDHVAMEIVGVVADTKVLALNAPSGEELYVPYPQGTWAAMTLVVRATSDPSPIIAAVRQAVHDLDAEMPVTGVKSMEEIVSGSVAQPRLIAELVGAFAGAALLLSALGIYGVMAYLVAQRSPEMAIRMALGARRGEVFRMVLRQGLRLVSIGVAVGLVVSFAVTRLLKTLLYGTDPIDAMTLAIVCGLFACVAIAACYLPARRATRLDPLAVLRAQ